MAEPNDVLRQARERTESPNATGDCLSRQELAELVNAWVYEHTGRTVELDANYIAKLEQGRIRWLRDDDRRAGLRAVLSVATDAELGLRRPRRSRSTLRGVERQQFIRAGLGVGAAAVTGPVALLDLLAPTQPLRVPDTVSVVHIDAVRAATEAFRTWDHHYGGGFMREAAAAQLRFSAELLKARCTPALRRDLLTSVGSFAETVGFIAYDDYAHDDARRMYRFGLACAEEADDWHLRAQVLCDLGTQESWCGGLDTALTYTEAALVRADRLTATERAMLHNSRARDLARLGDVQDTLRALGTADEQFSHAHPAEDPPWMASYTEARHTGFCGNVLWELGMQGQYVTETQTRLTTAIATRSAGRARTRNRIRLANLHMAHGDPIEAATLGHQALDGAGALRSRRAHDDLRDLRRLATTHHKLPAVADLRDRIHTVLAAA